MKGYVAAVLAAGVALLAASVGTALAQPGVRPMVSEPPRGDTVVEVTGDAANGFGIHYYDGTASYPATDSEARAECNEYDTRVARVRCRTEVRTWYRDLTDLKQALDWAHESG